MACHERQRLTPPPHPTLNRTTNAECRHTNPRLHFLTQLLLCVWFCVCASHYVVLQGMRVCRIQRVACLCVFACLATHVVCAETYVSIVAILCACVLCCNVMSARLSLCLPPHPSYKHVFGWEHLVLGIQSCYFNVFVFTCLHVHCTRCVCLLTCVCCALTMRSVHVVNESYIQPNKTSSSTDFTTCTNMCNVLAPFWGHY